MIVAKRSFQRVKRDATGNIERIIDLGFVGEPDQINAEVLETIANSDLIPVVARPSGGQTRRDLQHQRRHRRRGVAGALSADRLLFLTDVPGVMDRQGNIITLADRLGGAGAHQEDGTISGGMIPKGADLHRRAERGRVEAVVIDGRIPHVLLVELFTEHGAGTLLRHD